MSLAGSLAIGVPARRCTSLIMFIVEEVSFWPMKRSTARSSRPWLVVNSWLLSPRPLVCTTAARSLAPT